MLDPDQHDPVDYGQCSTASLEPRSERSFATFEKNERLDHQSSDLYYLMAYARVRVLYYADAADAAVVTK